MLLIIEKKCIKKFQLLIIWWLIFMHVRLHCCWSKNNSLLSFVSFLVFFYGLNAFKIAILNWGPHKPIVEESWKLNKKKIESTMNVRILVGLFSRNSH